MAERKTPRAPQSHPCEARERPGFLLRKTRPLRPALLAADLRPALREASFCVGMLPLVATQQSRPLENHATLVRVGLQC